MKKIVKSILLFLILFNIKSINVLALTSCTYIDSNSNEIVMSVGGTKGDYYFNDTTYGFTSKSNLANGECPSSVIKLNNGVYCAPGYMTSDTTSAAAVCNSSFTTGTKYTIKDDTKVATVNPNDALVVNSENISIYVDDIKTNITGKLIDSKTYVSLNELCTVLDCEYGYKDAKKTTNKTYKDSKILTINTSLSSSSTKFANFFFEIEYDISNKKYSSYINVGEDTSNLNRFKLKDLGESASILVGDSDDLPTLGNINDSTADLYVPVRIIANGLGKEVKWNGSTKSVYISTSVSDYYHAVIDSKDAINNDEINISSIHSDSKVSISKNDCLSVVAVNSDNKLLYYTTALSFYSQNTLSRANKDFQFVTSKLKETNDSYTGISDSICAIGAVGDSDDVVSISVKNYYPTVAKHTFVIDEGDKEEDNLTGTIINVPVDSRPVSTSNFEQLALAAGFDYYEVAGGLDSNSLDNLNYGFWHSGDVSTVQEELENLVGTISTNDTTVIINLSSYMFGGLIGTRNPDMYNSENINSSLARIAELVKANPNLKFYINFAIPRTQPDTRAYNWLNGSKDSETYEGILYYLDGLNDSKTTYVQALTDWAYLYYMKLESESNYEALPESLKSFYNDFYSANTENCDKYVSMFNEVTKIIGVKDNGTYTNNLLNLSSNNSNVRVIIGMDDYELPFSIKGLTSSWIVKDSTGVIKYSGGYNSYGKYEKETENLSSSFINIYAVDEVDHVILARELNSINGSTTVINKNYSDSSLADYVSTYTKDTTRSIINKFETFINNESSNSGGTNKINGYFIGKVNNPTNIVSSIYSSVDNDDNTMVIDFHDDDSSTTLSTYTSLLKGDMFNISSYGGWNTYGNAIGIQISRNVVYAQLKKDIEKCIESKKCTSNKLTLDLENRVVAYDKTRLIGVLEDIVYNSLRYNQSLSISSYKASDSYTKAIKKINQTTFNIGGYIYKYSNVSVSSSKSWNRDFEVKLDISLTLK